MNIEIKNIDITKLDLGLRHEYIPDTIFNNSLDDKDKIVIDCEYFGVGEKAKFSSVTPDGEATLDLRKIFQKKVRGIRNLQINGKSVTTADEFLRFPSIPVLDAIMSDVVVHIVTADDLSEDERKN